MQSRPPQVQLSPFLPKEQRVPGASLHQECAGFCRALGGLWLSDWGQRPLLVISLMLLNVGSTIVLQVEEKERIEPTEEVFIF